MTLIHLFLFAISLNRAAEQKGEKSFGGVPRKRFGKRTLNRCLPISINPSCSKTDSNYKKIVYLIVYL